MQVAFEDEFYASATSINFILCINHTNKNHRKENIFDSICIRDGKGLWGHNTHTDPTADRVRNRVSPKGDKNPLRHSKVIVRKCQNEGYTVYKFCIYVACSKFISSAVPRVLVCRLVRWYRLPLWDDVNRISKEGFG